MNRKEAAEFSPIIQAFAEGRDIEYRTKGFNENWKKVTQIPALSFKSFEYRIKPEPSYRPFANAEECWQEMLKHQPFGYIYFASEKLYHNIMMLAPEQGAHEAYIRIGNSTVRGLEEAFRVCTFADGTPFGIKEE